MNENSATLWIWFRKIRWFTDQTVNSAPGKYKSQSIRATEQTPFHFGLVGYHCCEIIIRNEAKCMGYLW